MQVQKTRTLEQYLESLIKLRDHDAAMVAAIALKEDAKIKRVVEELGSPSEQALYAYSCGAADLPQRVERRNAQLGSWQVTPK